MTGFCEHVNELSDFINLLSACQLFKKCLATLSSLVPMECDWLDTGAVRDGSAYI